MVPRGTTRKKSKIFFFFFLIETIKSTVTAKGHARAHDLGIDTMRMSMNPDLGIFAPLKMPMRKIFCFLFFLAIYQLKIFYKQHNSTKLDKGYRLVYKLSCLITKKNRLFLGEI